MTVPYVADLKTRMSWNSDLPFSRTSSTWRVNFCPGHMASVSLNHPSLISTDWLDDGVRERPELDAMSI
jgi:hypothetical protein